MVGFGTRVIPARAHLVTDRVAGGQRVGVIRARHPVPAASTADIGLRHPRGRRARPSRNRPGGG